MWLAKLRVVVGVQEASEHPRFRVRNTSIFSRNSTSSKKGIGLKNDSVS